MLLLSVTLVGGAVEQLTPSDTGTAWGHDFPTRQLLPVAGLVAFHDELVHSVLDGGRLPETTEDQRRLTRPWGVEPEAGGDTAGHAR